MDFTLFYLASYGATYIASTLLKWGQLAMIKKRHKKFAPDDVKKYDWSLKGRSILWIVVMTAVPLWNIVFTAIQVWKLFICYGDSKKPIEGYREIEVTSKGFIGLNEDDENDK